MTRTLLYLFFLLLLISCKNDSEIIEKRANERILSIFDFKYPKEAMARSGASFEIKKISQVWKWDDKPTYTPVIYHISTKLTIHKESLDTIVNTEWEYIYVKTHKEEEREAILDLSKVESTIKTAKNKMDNSKDLPLDAYILVEAMGNVYFKGNRIIE